ncbi:MAG: hypothetical protein NTY77_03055 [Elusimicrobia bacterium]|nr:hypothetical protein [Elusimicrobiota bacterium]
MNFELVYLPDSAEQRRELAASPAHGKVWKAVCKTLALLETNLRHPSLNTHKFLGLRGPNGQEVFEAYAQQATPGAYRVFWCYGPGKGQITIIAITPHP